MIKKKPPGPSKTARNLENIVKVREAMVRSPWRSEKSASVTVISENYCDMLQNFLCPKLWRRHLRGRQVYFQKDGATAHTA